MSLSGKQINKLWNTNKSIFNEWQKHCAEQQKPDTQEHVLCDSTYMEYRYRQN